MSHASCDLVRPSFGNLRNTEPVCSDTSIFLLHKSLSERFATVTMLTKLQMRSCLFRSVAVMRVQIFGTIPSVLADMHCSKIQ